GCCMPHGGATDCAQEVTLSHKGSKHRVDVHRPRRTGTGTAKLTEALRLQAATSDVLCAISRSPEQLEPVFQAVLEHSTQACDAKFGSLYLLEGGILRAATMHNAPPGFAEACASLANPHWDTAIGRAAATKQAAQIADITKSQGYAEGHWYV